ncbi:MAG: hypothetical protein E2584_04995, partial [Microbacterium sp.]|nr:hypothetical protein [Microbacterium sp.]
RALEILADEVPDHLRVAGELRLAHRDASLDELGHHADPPLTKDAVAGRIRPGTTVGDLFRAAFPAGSMTGAPKLSAMTLLRGIEDAPRGVFSGTVGWIADDGTMDLAMVIRTVLVHPDGAYVGAGGGITWYSDAAEEVAEVGVKARAPLAALGARVPAGW